MKLNIVTLLLVLHFTKGLHQDQVTTSNVIIQSDPIQTNEAPIPVSATDHVEEEASLEIGKLNESINQGIQSLLDTTEATPEISLTNAENTAPSIEVGSQQFSITPTPIQPSLQSPQAISSPETDFQSPVNIDTQNQVSIQNEEQILENSIEQGVERINQEQDGKETQIQSIPIVLPSMPQPTTSLPNPTKGLSEIGQQCLNKCRNLNGISCKKWEGDSITCCQFTGCQWPFYCNPDKIIIVPGCDNKP